MDESEERRGRRETDKEREEGWKGGVVKMKLKGGRQRNTAEEEGRKGRKEAHAEKK